MRSTIIHKAWRFTRHVLTHAHEVAVGVVVEAGNLHLSLLLLAIGVLLILFAMQLAFTGEVA